MSTLWRNLMALRHNIKEIHEFTWSPDETRFSLERSRQTIEDLTKYCAFYYYCPELRDYDSPYGLHYHGVFIVYDDYRWQRNLYKLRRYLKGIKCNTPNIRIKIKPQRLKEWHKYMYKDYHLNQTVYTNIKNCQLYNIDNMYYRTKFM